MCYVQYVLLFILLIIMGIIIFALRRHLVTAKYGGAVELHWVNKNISHSASAKCKKFVRDFIAEGTNFGELTDDDIAKFKRFLSSNHDLSHLPPETLFGLRNVELAIHGMRNNKLPPDVLATSDKTPANVLSLSKQYKVSPVKVAKLIGAEITPEISAADITSVPLGQKNRAQADKYEKEIGAFLTKLKIKHQTEDELRALRAAPADGAADSPAVAKVNNPAAVGESAPPRAQGESAAPSAVLTPDFLLDKAININGKEIHWIDAKNYPFTLNPLLTDKNRAQAKKYNARYGFGAFIFNGGVMDNHSSIPALCLDGSKQVRDDCVRWVDSSITV